MKTNITSLINYNSAFGYAGYFVHARSGLNLTVHRAYCSTLARSINRDPIGESGGVNLYGYVGADPIDGVDPSGLWGGGVLTGGSVEAGLGLIGLGANISGGVGIFTESEPGGFVNASGGSFVSGGAFFGWGSGSRSLFKSPGRSQPKPLPKCNPPWAFGASAGFVLGEFVSNAENVSNLAGPFDTYSFSFSIEKASFTLQFGFSGDTCLLSGTAGLGLGVSASGFTTNTILLGK